jgi:hypothetical protein
MAETPREIEAHIDRTRERLGSNLKELEHKVDAATDWREQFRARPYVFLGAAFAGGATLAIALHARSTRVPASDGRARAFSAAAPGSAQAQVLELWDTLKGALIGVASTRLKDYIAELLPDFNEHYRQAEARLVSSGASRTARL